MKRLMLQTIRIIMINVLYILVSASGVRGAGESISVRSPDGREVAVIDVRVEDSHPFYSLTEWAHAVDADLDWDFVTGIAEMRFRDHRLRFSDRGRGVWINGRMQSIPKAVFQADGDMWIPLKLLDDLTDSLWEGELVWDAKNQILHRFAENRAALSTDEQGSSDHQLVVVLDPGHGGADSGCIHLDGSLEKDVALKIVNRLVEIITNRIGAQVVLTRSGDTDVSIDRRAAEANRSGGDLFVSIHIAHPVELSGKSFCVYVLPPSTVVDSGAYLAPWESRPEMLVQKTRTCADEFAGGMAATANNREYSIEERNAAVLNGLTMPAFVVEMSWDASFFGKVGITEEGGRNRAAEAIFDGIRRCLKRE